MSRIELTGLIGSHPLGALASFGLLRLLAQSRPEARIVFVERDDWVAALESGIESPDQLVSILGDWSSNREVPAALGAFGEEDVRVAPSKFRQLLRESLETEAENLPLASFLVALAADGAEDNTKHMVKPSPFYMASGQQSFIDTMKKIHSQARGGEVWNECLFGPWRYATAEWGCGWDPGTERMHALRSKAPTKEKTACVVGAVRLAFEALPLFPTFSVGEVVHTVGWTEERRLDQFRWPIPSVSVSVATLSLLLSSPEVLDPKPLGPRREGLAAIYESTRHEFGQGYAVFRPARRLA